MALTKLTKNLIDGTFGTEWVSTIQTSNFTAEAGKGYFVNTTANTITINLPAGVVGSEIVIQDYAGTFATNKVIFSANGSEKIQGVTDDFECVTNNATVTLIYQDATKGWTADNIVAPLPPLTVNYLVVAGGGSGGADSNSGGGGAGGLRTSYGSTSGGGSSAESTLNLNPSTNYTVTIGAGGATASPGTYPASLGNDGNDSVFSTITSIGGGGGAGQNGTPSGKSGGSGGGGGYMGQAGGSGTANQGFAGGSGVNSYPYPGGGGGGAAEAGNTDGNAHGGDGLSVSITGSAVFYAGGGGGSVSSGAGNNGGPGGDGGGGEGAGDIANSAGTVNTGGGGGGYGANSSNGAAGGSGIVILRYPSAYIISGLSGTTTTVGTDKVTTFTNAGTGNIQFN